MLNNAKDRVEEEKTSENLEEELDEEEDTPIFLQTARAQVYGTPLFVTIEVGNLALHNCMVDTGASSNIMLVNIMEKFGLQITRPLKNVCVLNNKLIPIVGPI